MVKAKTRSEDTLNSLSHVSNMYALNTRKLASSIPRNSANSVSNTCTLLFLVSMMDLTLHQGVCFCKLLLLQ